MAFKFLIEAIVWLSIIGFSKNRTELCLSLSSNKLYLLPTGSDIWVTSFSLIASNGGLETCANICLKYVNKFWGFLESIEIGESLPIDPTGSLEDFDIGSIKYFKSSWVYPKTCCILINEDLNLSGSTFFKSFEETLFFVNHSEYGFEFASDSFISSSCTIRPSSKSIKNILPGLSLSRYSICSLSISTKPVSEPIIKVPSLVTEYLNGLKPFLSRIAPTFLPSVHTTRAGPSQGSIKMLWNL